MIKLIFVAAVATVGLCVPLHEKVAKIFNDFDYNKDDLINKNEVLAFFHNLKAKPEDSLIAKATFVKNWSKTYADSTAVSEKFFGNLDGNNDGLLTDADVDILYASIDRNRNGIQWAEFEPVINGWYSSSE